LKNQQHPPILARFPDTLSVLTNLMEVEVAPGSGYNTGTFFVGRDRVSLKEAEEMKLKLILILVALAALATEAAADELEDLILDLKYRAVQRPIECYTGPW